MKRICLLFSVIIFLFELNAQQNPQQKIVSNNNVANRLQLSDSITGGPIRFGVTMTGDFQANKSLSFSQRYNTNTFMTTIATDGITIKKSGLYHFEGFIYAEAFDDADKANGWSNPVFTSILKAGGHNYTVGFREIMPGVESYRQGQVDARLFKFSKSFAMEIYVVAPSVISFSRIFNSTITNESQFYSGGWLTGYYISQ